MKSRNKITIWVPEKKKLGVSTKSNFNITIKFFIVQLKKNQLTFASTLFIHIDVKKICTTSKCLFKKDKFNLKWQNTIPFSANHLLGCIIPSLTHCHCYLFMFHFINLSFPFYIRTFEPFWHWSSSCFVFVYWYIHDVSLSKKNRWPFRECIHYKANTRYKFE